MDTFEERRRQTHDMMTDPDVDRSFKEVCGFMFHWLGFEFALLRKARAQRTAVKHANALNEMVDVFSFRKQTKDL